MAAHDERRQIHRQLRATDRADRPERLGRQLLGHVQELLTVAGAAPRMPRTNWNQYGGVNAPEAM
jgi:hypothetical protein